MTQETFVVKQTKLKTTAKCNCADMKPPGEARRET